MLFQSRNELPGIWLVLPSTLKSARRVLCGDASLFANLDRQKGPLAEKLPPQTHRGTGSNQGGRNFAQAQSLASLAERSRMTDGAAAVWR